MELRFDNNNEIYVELCDTIYAILSHKEMIPEVPVDSTPAPKKIVHEYKEPIPEPFEKRRINEVRAAESRSVYGQSVTSTVKITQQQNLLQKRLRLPPRMNLHMLSPSPSRL